MRILLGIVVAMTVACLGCGDDAQRSPNTGGGTTPVPPVDTTCSTPTTGCPCSAVGTTASCSVRRVAGAYVSCSDGTLRCGADGVWGDCEGAATVWGETATDASPAD